MHMHMHMKHVHVHVRTRGTPGGAFLDAVAHVNRETRSIIDRRHSTDRAPKLCARRVEIRVDGSKPAANGVIAGLGEVEEAAVMVGRARRGMLCKIRVHTCDARSHTAKRTQHSRGDVEHCACTHGCKGGHVCACESGRTDHLITPGVAGVLAHHPATVHCHVAIRAALSTTPLHVYLREFGMAHCACGISIGRG